MRRSAERIFPPSTPCRSRRRKAAWASAIAVVLTTDPSTTPFTPSGEYSAADTATFTARFPIASDVLSQGRWRLKKVREKRRRAPFAGRGSAQTNKAAKTGGERQVSKGRG